jgi:hypothetical protein
MGGPRRVLAGLLRQSARLMPAERRDWAEALWAEADQVRPGRARLAWRAGGVRLIAQEALLTRRLARTLVFAAAAGWLAHAAWPGPADNPATALARLDVVTVVPVLAGLPLLARWLFGPAAAGRTPRVLRTGAYVAVLVLTVAKASVRQVADNPAIVSRLNSDAQVPVKDGMIYAWLTESLFLLAVAVYVAVILAATARRPRVAPATLAAATGAGVALGGVMYAVAPLGLASHSTNPWVHGFPIGLAVLLAWVLLFGAPTVAAVVAVRCHRGPGGPEQAFRARVKLAVAAGFLATAVGALVVSVLGTVTIALMPRAAWVLHWLYPGQRLSAAIAHTYELTASVRSGGYGLIMLVFPVVGLIVGLVAGGLAVDAPPTGAPPGGGGGEPGPPVDPGRTVSTNALHDLPLSR